MALVGPRPIDPSEAQVTMMTFPSEYASRIKVKPGITGLWQVGEKNITTWEEMLKLDVFYAEHRTFWLTVRILLKTPSAILRRALE